MGFDLLDEDHQKLLWVMAVDNSRFAWISGSTLHLRPAAEGSKTIYARLAHNALALTLLRNGNARCAIAGVSGNWNKAAYDLLRKYGIKTVACSDDQIAQELPRFLQVLAGDVRQLVKQSATKSISTNA